MTSRRRTLWAAGGALLGAALTSCAQIPPASGAMPLPDYGGVARLRTAYFHNPAFPAPPAGFIEAVLAEVARACPAHFGLSVQFEGGERATLQDAFAHLTPAARERVRETVFGEHSPPWRRGELVQSLEHQMVTTGLDLPELWRRAGPHVGGAAPATMGELAERLVERQLATLAQWAPFFGSDVVHLFPAWLAAAHAGRWPWELVLTNQLVASAEYGWAEFEAAIRVGVTNGITTESPASRHGLVSVATLYPFYGNDPTLVALRGGLRGGGPESVRWAAALVLHELGHQLLHLHHPRNAACVMRPTPSLHFDEWVAQHDPLRCAVGSEPAMTPGAVKFKELRKAAASP